MLIECKSLPYKKIRNTYTSVKMTKTETLAYFAILFLPFSTAASYTQGLVPHPAKAGRILVYSPLVSKSIKVKIWPLLEEMVGRGHEIVTLLPYCDEEDKLFSNMTIVDPGEPASFLKAYTEYMGSQDTSFVNKVLQMNTMIQEIIEGNKKAMDNSKLQQELQKGFDLVVVHTPGPHFPGYYLAENSNAALVLYGTAQGPNMFSSWSMGQPFNPAYMPTVISSNSVRMKFTERLKNVLGTILAYITNYGILYPMSEQILDRLYPGLKRSSLQQIESNVSLMLHTGHPILDGVRPVSPNFQYVGFTHCREGKALPHHLEEFIEKSSNGTILVSFGTHFPSNQDVMKIMKNVFKKLEHRVLWKWNLEMEDKPDNVLVSDWLPQQDILGHPNTKLFITHGGQSSLQEALYHKKPVVVIPLGYDQPFYAMQAENLGFGKSISHEKMTKEDLYTVILDVLNNQSYAKAAENYGHIVTNQLTRPLDRAVWWLEFVMHNKDTNYFHSPVHDLNWFSYFLLDVIVALVLTIAFIWFTLHRLFWFAITREISGPHSRENKTKTE